MLHKGTRWVYQQAGWFGDFDNCLWDILGKVAGLPVYDLIGRVRQRFPVYLTSGESPLEVYLDVIEEGREVGVNAYKFHTYKGGKADIPIFREVRRIVGPDYLLMNDPVCSYTLEEAIEVGHVMEELGFLWLEEPLHEQKERQYRRLCKELTMPVMGNETLMHDVGLSTQRLMSGATDLLRANARFGTTQALKMAHFAEMYDTNIELNHEGGLFGLVHTHLGCCIDNTGFFEAGLDNLTGRGQRWGMLNPPAVVDGHLTPPDGPGWGAEWDRDRFNHMTVETH
jgi:L-alanine-DL-glutamate epimerase-like enolase superfamily enzyme